MEFKKCRDELRDDSIASAQCQCRKHSLTTPSTLHGILFMGSKTMVTAIVLMIEQNNTEISGHISSIIAEWYH